MQYARFQIILDGEAVASADLRGIAEEIWAETVIANPRSDVAMYDTCTQDSEGNNIQLESISPR